MSHPTRRPAHDLVPGDIIEWRGERITVLDADYVGADRSIRGRTRDNTRVSRVVPIRRRFIVYGHDAAIAEDAADRAADRRARRRQEEASRQRWQEARTT